jgi:hypothetical protein
MTPDTTPALRPVQPQTDFLVEPRPDLGLTAVPWLLAAADDPQRARRELDRGGVALLRCGVRFTAGLVQAAADSDDLRGIDAYLGQVLPGGPAFADTRWGLYYVLVPAGTDRLPPWSYHSEDAECLGPNAYLGVPDPTHTDPGVGFSYWCVPPHEAKTLCSPDAVAQLLKDCRCRLTAAEANTGA